MPAARALLHQEKDPNWVHPPLAKVIIGGSIAAFGDQPWSWRFPSVMAAAMACGFFFLLARDLFKSSFLGFYAGLLYLLDGLTFVQARLATLDMLFVGFLIPAIYYFRKEKYLVASIFFALSLSCKWTALFALPFFLLIKFPAKWSTLKTLTLHFLLPVILIYGAIFVLFADPHHSVKGMIKTHVDAMKFHLRPSMTHPYKAPWWKWFLLIRPIWYEYKEQDGVMRGIVALPNPLLWWPAILSLAGLIFKLKREEARFILLGVLAFLLPWVFSVKGGFLYYLLPLSPFLILSLVLVVREKRFLMVSCFILALLGFVLFFPLYADWPISKSWEHHLIWLKTWI